MRLPHQCADNIKRNEIPSVDELSRCFFYNPETGELTSVRSGRVVGYKTDRGYINITHFGKKYYAHRLIWKMLHGYDPKEIDHINGNKSDNRAVNLRDVDRSGNNKNKPLQKNNSSGARGVHFCNINKTWNAQIILAGKTKHIGAFRSCAEAIAARRGAEIAIGYYDE